MDNTQIEKLFVEYEKAFNDLDVKKSAEFFAENFISAGPKGTIAQNKKDFLKKAEQASAFYRSVGQTSAKNYFKKYNLHQRSIYNGYCELGSGF